VTVSGLTLAGGDAANYQLGAIALTADIAQRLIGIRANDRSKLEGATDPALTFSVTSGSLAPGDAFGGSLTRAPGETLGDYVIDIGTLSAGADYDASFTSGVFSIVAPSSISRFPDVALLTNPLWRLDLEEESEEDMPIHARIVFPGGSVRRVQLPAVRGDDRGAVIVIKEAPLSRVAPPSN